MKPQITKELIESVLNDITPKKKEREFTMYAGCRTRGYIKWSSSNIDLCSDINCPTCNMMRKALKDELQNWRINIDEIKNNIT